MWWGQYVGIPFADKGRDREACDCWGLVRLIYEEQLGVNLPSYADDYANSDDREILHALIEAEKDAKWVEVKEPKPYDVIVMNMMGLPTHVGIVLNNRLMLHCMRGMNAVVEDFTNLKWRNRVKGFARWNS